MLLYIRNHYQASGMPISPPALSPRRQHVIQPPTQPEFISCARTLKHRRGSHIYLYMWEFSLNLCMRVWVDFLIYNLVEKVNWEINICWITDTQTREGVKGKEWESGISIKTSLIAEEVFFHVARDVSVSTGCVLSALQAVIRVLIVISYICPVTRGIWCVLQCLDQWWYSDWFRGENLFMFYRPH